MVNLTELELQNVWWNKSIDEDFHLQKLAVRKYIYSPGLLDAKELLREKSGIYTLIGPRQIGKTTYLKQLVKELLPSCILQNIFYYSCENLSKEQLRGTLLFFLSQIAKKGPKFILLDEVSLVDGWEMIELEMYNKGLLIDTTIINSGSSSLNLKKSAERLPGRKGKGKTCYFLPLSFREFVFLVSPQAKEIEQSPLTSISTLTTLFKQYVEASGFPQIINDYFENKIDDSRYDIYKDWIEGEVTKAKRSSNYAYQILSRVLESQSSQLNWESIAKNSTIKSHTTIADYIDLLDSLFIVKVVNQIENNLKLRLARNKKVYFFDHFLFSVVEKSILKINNYSEYYRQKLNESGYLSKVVENIVFSNLLKHVINKGYSLNDTIFFWRSKTQQEIDFMVYIRTGQKKLVTPIEVKYRNQVERSSLKSFRPIILSKDTYAPEKNIIPVPLFLFKIDQYVKT